MLSIALNRLRSVFASNRDPSEQDPCWIDNMPMEIISEILLTTIDSYGDNIRLRWKFPLLMRRVSRRFYHATTNTRSLWRYLHIRHPIHPYLQKHIARSGSLSLVIDVIHHGEASEEGSDREDNDGEDDDEEDIEEGNGEVETGVASVEDNNRRDDCQGWREFVKLLVPLLPRVASLSVHSPLENGPIVELLRYQMPILELLDVRGDQRLPYRLGSSLTRLPALRCLKSHTFFDLRRVFKVPDTLEELYLCGSPYDMLDRSEHLWSCLPSSLRVLELEDIDLLGIKPPYNYKFHLPRLAQLCFSESGILDTCSVLRFLDAPRLQSLKVVLNFLFPAWDTASWSLEFPELTHLEWESKTQSVRFETLLGRCNNLRYARIKTERCSTLMAEFLTALVDDVTFLPQLEGLGVSGSSLPDVKKVLQARPQLRNVEIREKDMRWKGPTQVEGYGEWEECKAWLESRASVSFWS